MKLNIDLEWLRGKSDAEVRQLFASDPGNYGWHSSPKVSAKEAEELRAGKPYRMGQYDLSRLWAATEWAGCNGDPDTDPFIIKMLSRDYLQENPLWREEENKAAARIAELERQYGPGKYSVGVGGSHPRWIATEAGKVFARQILEG